MLGKNMVSGPRQIPLTELSTLPPFRAVQIDEFGPLCGDTMDNPELHVMFSILTITCVLDLFTNDVILAFDDALRWNKCRMDIEIELTKGIFFLEVVFPSTKAHFDLTHPS